MRADTGSRGLDADWNRVSLATPCPICGGGSWCCTHADEEFACCLHRPSDWRLDNGGWLHRIERVRAAAPALHACAEPRPTDASSGVGS